MAASRSFKLLVLGLPLPLGGNTSAEGDNDCPIYYDGLLDTLTSSDEEDFSSEEDGSSDSDRSSLTVSEELSLILYLF